MAMKKDINEFVKNHRDEFDNREVSGDSWEPIFKALPDSQKSLKWWRAAAVLFFVSTLTLLLAPPIYRKIERKATLEEFSAIERFYNGLIVEKVSLIEGYGNGQVGDLRQLEAMYYVLKEEMMNDPSDEVIDALVLNLLIRIDILNEQVKQLEQNRDLQESERGKGT